MKDALNRFGMLVIVAAILATPSVTQADDGELAEELEEAFVEQVETIEDTFRETIEGLEGALSAIVEAIEELDEEEDRIEAERQGLLEEATKIIERLEGLEEIINNFSEDIEEEDEEAVGDEDE